MRVYGRCRPTLLLSARLIGAEPIRALLLALRCWRANGSILTSMLDLSRIDLEEVANALADQADCERQWLIDPQTGKIAFWTADTGIDGQTHGRPRRPGPGLHRPTAVLGLVSGHGRLRRGDYR